MKKKLLAMTLILILIIVGCGSGSAAQDSDSNQEKGEEGTDKIVGVADTKDVSGDAGNQEVKDDGNPDTSGSASSDANKGSSTDSSGAGSSETTGKPGSASSDKSIGISSGSGSSEASGGQTCKHNWAEETTTVNHEATGHYETQVVKEAWDEPVYEMREVTRCSTCEVILGPGTAATQHLLDTEHDGYYSHGEAVLVKTVHHEAETKQVWVEDKAAWTETVGTGKYKCSLCGKAK